MDTTISDMDVLKSLDFHPPCELEGSKREAYCEKDHEHNATWWLKFQCDHDIMVCDTAEARIERMLLDGGGPECVVPGCPQYYTAILDSKRFG